MNFDVAYNERSWAIDLIGHIKSVILAQNRSIKGAGGEQTVRTEGGSLFPDVLLFGDRSLALILQGWELKMPDTRIDDPDFLDNATKKALALGLDSFVLWNVSHARLYYRIAETNLFRIEKSWDDLAHIRDRRSVVGNRRLWENLAIEIIDHLNDLFDRGSLEGRPFVDAYKSGGITGLIMTNMDAVAEALAAAASRDVQLDAEIVLWWSLYQTEYGGDNKFSKLAQANISNWIGKLLFAHILQGIDQRAQAVAQIIDDTTPERALAIFQQLSQDCNFWTIFSNSIGLAVMPKRAWEQMRQLNRLLTDLRIGTIDQAQLSGILEATVDVAVRKLRGQYPTPLVLAKLLVKLCMQDVENDKILDACCGSGTIPRAALEQKLSMGIDADTAAASVFAGDNDPQAIQIATFALAKPDLMHMPLRVFRHDAFFLEPETEIEFRNPTNGEPFTERIGHFNAIASNLPFVSQAGRSQYEEAIEQVSTILDDNGAGSLPLNADIAAYLPFALYPLLAANGRMGIIITNAWLSTAWGDAFIDLLNRYYKLKTVITSGAGRWFQNSLVVTNILILEKREIENVEDENEATEFVVFTQPLEELADDESLAIAAAQIELGQTQDESMTIRSVSRQRRGEFKVFGLAGNAQFVNCDWILDLRLVPVRNIFEIRRGERRGWDKMFYPSPGHEIEEQYIKPVLKSPSDINRYITAAETDAFSCASTLDELAEYGHVGALNWISRFENGVNNKNKPLRESLAKPGMHWYEMNTDGLAQLAMPLNFGNRLFISRLIPPAFVNQRLVQLNTLDGVDLDLCHALLNTAIAMFMIEGMGFGRGQGALDLSKDRIENFMHMLDPEQLNDDQAEQVKRAFVPLLQRQLLDVADELEMPDRQFFDDTVLAAFELDITRERIYDSLRQLVGIRQAAID